MNTALLRTVGVATAAYGLAVTLRPQLLARPSGLVDRRGEVAHHTATSLRPLGFRDAASGAALALAPEGPALRTAAAVRLAADFGDAVLLAGTLPKGNRAKAVAVAVGWGSLTLAGLVHRSRG
ncbi:hypothetical protein MTQ01_09615 [Streptomyces sp. XM4193]|uniref:DUF4267 domain-containing protein n=1 Tax=Streptomyces tardus TaxID=2780544 RepID=A0A949N9C4_9ACTN|nr:MULTISPECIES: hypothetical protein [Streptomyces]MBU7599451.1 hypothetical protein [Streptomyces tardus]MCK1796255.1 hypothetical protein [Streptomyces sp. XM4193]